MKRMKSKPVSIGGTVQLLLRFNGLRFSSKGLPRLRPLAQDGEAHLRGIILTTPLYYWGVYRTLFPFSEAFPALTAVSVLMAIVYLCGGVWLSPDLDLAHSIPTKSWGPLKWIWRSYHGNHRGISHYWIKGTLSRLSVLKLPLLAICALAWSTVTAQPGITIFEGCILLSIGAVLIFISLEASALWHLFCDGLII